MNYMRNGMLIIAYPIYFKKNWNFIEKINKNVAAYPSFNKGFVT